MATLGLLALHDGLTALALTTHLELSGTEALGSWLGRLPALGLVTTSGRTKGTRYFVPPELLERLEFTPRTTLTRIEPHRLAALIVEDLGRYPDSAISEIHARIGAEIPRSSVKSSLAHLVKVGTLAKLGERKGSRYRLAPSSPRSGSSP